MGKRQKDMVLKILCRSQKEVKGNRQQFYLSLGLAENDATS